MRVIVYVPLMVSLLLAALSRRAARRLPPAAATRVLTTAAVTTAAASTWMLGLLVASTVGWLPAIAESGHFSRLSWAQRDPTPLFAGVAADCLLTLVAVRVARWHRTRRAARKAIRNMCAGASTELVIVEDTAPHAVAMPSRGGGHIIVSSGMLRTLDAQERRILFAHERAHLAFHHHRYLAAVALCAAVNPLLARVRGDVGFACERWADEQAAGVGGDRQLAVRALARAALAALDAAVLPGLAFNRLSLTHRLAALQLPPPRRRPALVAAFLLFSAVASLAAGDATLAFARFVATVVPSVQEIARSVHL